MNFKFKISISDGDYLDYNVFWSLKSPYGKKQVLQLRFITALFVIIVAVASLLGSDLSPTAWICLIPYGILLVLLELSIKPFYSLIIKANIKSLKKRGKMGYSPVAEMEFSDESFVEITPDNKTEQRYSAVERVSVIREKVVYIHVNNVMAYILPISCFESKEQCYAFIDFLRTKCTDVDIY